MFCEIKLCNFYCINLKSGISRDFFLYYFFSICVSKNTFLVFMVFYYFSYVVDSLQHFLRHINYYYREFLYFLFLLVTKYLYICIRAIPRQQFFFLLHFFNPFLSFCCYLYFLSIPISPILYWSVNTIYYLGLTPAIKIFIIFFPFLLSFRSKFCFFM